MIKRCGYCGEEIKTYKSQDKKFCNNACRNADYRVRLNEKASAWKGDSVSYSGLHKWVNSHFGQPDKCEKCGVSGKGKMMTWASKDGVYTRNREDWMRLCPTCHKMYDNIRKRYAKFIGKEETWENVSPIVNQM